jgi:hypothetical protein
MRRQTISMIFFAFLVSGCASDGKMQPSDGASSTPDSRPSMSTSTMSDGGAAPSSQTMSPGGASVSTPTMSASAAESNAMKPPSASKGRIAAGVEEETLDTCLARIPQDATAGQKLLAEQTCRRDFATRR